MTEAMKVWRFSGVETMAMKLRETQRRQGEGTPWSSQHLLVKSNFYISASELFTGDPQPRYKYASSFLLSLLCNQYSASHGISEFPLFCYPLNSDFFFHRLHLLLWNLASPAHCVLSPNSPPQVHMPSKSSCLFAWLSLLFPQKVNRSAIALSTWIVLLKCFKKRLFWNLSD